MVTTDGIATVLVLGVLLFIPSVASPAHGRSVPESCSESPLNPVLNDSAGYTHMTSTGEWFAYNNTYQEPTVVETSAGLRMWYAGYVGGLWGIYTATSRDGGNWTVDPTPALTVGPVGSWDSSVYTPSVLFNGSGFLMYYGGDNGTLQARSIGVALSADGVHWTKYAENPVLKPGPGRYDGNWIKSPDALFINGTYYMWYVGSAPLSYIAPGGYQYFEAIDLATSDDGLHWTKYLDSPVFLGAPDEITTAPITELNGTTVYEHMTAVGSPDVLDVNGTLVMLYGDGTGIRYATSYDARGWTPASGYLVSSAQAYWKSDYLSEPAATLDGTRLALWYLGYSPVLSQSSPYVGGIGLARCSLVIVPVSRTVTTTLVTTSIQVTTSTTTIVSSTTTTGLEVPILEGATAFAAILAVSLFYLLVKGRPR